MRELGALVAGLGAYPIIPHSNTSHFDGLATDTFWLEGTMELLRRCDAVFLAEDWERSSGSRAERIEALRLGIPVFYTLESLHSWLSSGEQLEAMGMVGVANVRENEEL